MKWPESEDYDIVGKYSQNIVIIYDYSLMRVLWNSKKDFIVFHNLIVLKKIITEIYESRGYRYKVQL